LGGESFGGFIFLHNTKFSSFGGTQKLYWKRVLESLYELFKFKQCCCNIVKVKNISIINIIIPFSKKILSKNVKDFIIFPYISYPPKALSSPPLPSELPNTA